MQANPGHEPQPVLMISTAPDEATACSVAQALLQAHVAACVNIVAGMRSQYWWQGRIEESMEWLLLIKSVRGLSSDVQRVLRESHPYDVPELIVLDIVDGWPPYLQWLVAQARGPACT